MIPSRTDRGTEPEQVSKMQLVGRGYRVSKVQLVGRGHRVSKLQLVEGREVAILRDRR